MALTTLDPITAFIVVDLQSGLVGSPFIHPIADIVTGASGLIAALRRRGLPIVLVNVGDVALGLFLARRFGRFHGGNDPHRT